MEVLHRLPWAAQDAVFQKLASIADVASLSKDERRVYDRNLKAYRDTIAVMEGQYIEGMEKGMEKGRLEERAGNARKMKMKGFSIADIADITGLTAMEVEKL